MTIRAAAPAVAATGAPIRVLVVARAPALHARLAARLGADDGLTIAGWFADSATLARSAAQLRPDAILLELRPDDDAASAIRRLMQERPTPVVVLTRDRAAAATALAAGALTALPPPGAEGKEATLLTQTLKSMARVPMIRRWAAKADAVAPEDASTSPERARLEIVVVAASTGGPQALRTLLGALPAAFPLPVVIVQHIVAGFEEGLVAWLAPLCSLPLALAEDGMALTAPAAYVAPGGRHLELARGMLRLTDAPPIGGHRPSATVLFRAAAGAYGAGAAGALLTGMGDDGAEGLAAIKRAGGLAIAQDETSSVVFGMPAAAIRRGLADHVLPPAAIAALLGRLVQADVER